MQRIDAPSLKSYTTFGIDVPVRAILVATSVADVVQHVHTARSAPQPWRVLGGGSNILPTRPLDITLLRMGIGGVAIVDRGPDWVDVAVGAGVGWHDFVTWAVEHGYGGVENLALIPGTVGAAPMQNIGAYGVEQERCFRSCTVVDTATGEERTMDKAECRFGYRESIFKREASGCYVITGVTYRLRTEPVIDMSYADVRQQLVADGCTEPDIADVYRAVVTVRRRKLPDPAILGNAGSFFKNPVVDTAVAAALRERFPDVPCFEQADGRVKLPAAWLIDRRGWKGRRMGGAAVHANQALVLVNVDHATGADVMALADAIVADVADTYGIVLEREVNIWD